MESEITHQANVFQPQRYDLEPVEDKDSQRLKPMSGAGQMKSYYFN